MIQKKGKVRGPGCGKGRSQQSNIPFRDEADEALGSQREFRIRKIKLLAFGTVGGLEFRDVKNCV